MPLINCKIHLELNWTKNCVMYGDNVYDANDNNNDTTFQITNTKLYALIVTLSTEDNVKLTKRLNEGFKRSIYWNEYKAEIDSKDPDNNSPLRIYPDVSFQAVKRLFVLAFDDTDNGDKKVERN